MGTDVKIPWWLWAIGAVAIAAGIAVGVLTGSGVVMQAVRATFFASAFAYFTTSMVDFREHFVFEKQLTASYFSMRAIPIGETINHTLTALVIVGIFVLARPIGRTVEPRDWFVLVAPAIFLALGWRDELAYHRK